MVQFLLPRFLACLLLVAILSKDTSVLAQGEQTERENCILRLSELPIETSGVEGVEKQTPTPYLQVFASGRVEANVGEGIEPSVLQLSEEQLQELSERIVRKHRFMRIDEGKLSKLTKKIDERFPGCAMSPKMQIEVTNGKQSNKVKVHASYMGHQPRFPNIKPLSDFVAVERVCRELMAVTHIGSFDQAEEILEQTNEELKKEDRRSKPLQLVDVQYSNRLEFNGLEVHFLRISKKGKHEIITRASWIRKTEEAAVEIQANVEKFVPRFENQKGG